MKGLSNIENKAKNNYFSLSITEIRATKLFPASPLIMEIVLTLEVCSYSPICTSSREQTPAISVRRRAVHRSCGWWCKNSRPGGRQGPLVGTTWTDEADPEKQPAIYFRGVHISKSWSTDNRSWSTAIFGWRSLTIIIFTTKSAILAIIKTVLDVHVDRSLGGIN